MSERDGMQGARRTATETYHDDRRGSEHQATPQTARAASYSVPPIEKAKVGAAFDRAASTYDAIARFQHDVCEHLMDVASEAVSARQIPARILDAGCGTGYGTELLGRCWPQSFIASCDLSADMLAVAMERKIEGVCGDIENLPFAAAAFDLAWSSLALQWCHPQLASAELKRVLSPGGMLVFSTLAPGTLHEIDYAFAGVDRHRHVLSFVPVPELKDELESAGFTDIRLREETWITHHADLPSLLATIRGIGANQIGGNRRRTMLGKSAWMKAQARYETLRDEKGRLPTTYRLVFGSAVKL